MADEVVVMECDTVGVAEAVQLDPGEGRAVWVPVLLAVLVAVLLEVRVAVVDTVGLGDGVTPGAYWQAVPV